MNAELGIDDSGAAHYRYAKLFYKLIDEIRAAYPELVIECCASGAMRTDLETLKHFDVFFPSDSSNPFTQTDMMIGFWHRFLPMKIMRWITLRESKDEIPRFGEKRNAIIAPVEATWEEFFAVDLESVLSVGFLNGEYGFSGDLASFSEENLQVVSRYVSLFKEIRPQLKDVECFCLQDTPAFKALEVLYGTKALLIVQYVASEKLFPRTIIPKGLEASEDYNVQGLKIAGDELLSKGFEFQPKCKGQQNKWRVELVWVSKPEGEK